MYSTVLTQKLIKSLLLYSILSSDIRQNSAVFAVKESYPGKAFIDKIK